MSAEPTSPMAKKKKRDRREKEPRQPRGRRAPIIELNEVTKVYPGGHMALDRVSLAIGRGEFVFLVGPTGCGKSTLIKMLIRELDATEGNVKIAGRDIGALPEKKIPQLRRNIGTVFQDFKLLPDRTVYDNVAYALQVIGASRAEIREQVPQTLRLVGLSTKLHSYPDQLSGGEQQRVSVARAFVNHPPLLLADEPSGNLDPVTSIGVMQLLYRINKTGTTVVVVTHDREMVDNMRRRVVELYEGRVVRDEVSGGYTEESTTEFGLRMRAEMGVGRGPDQRARSRAPVLMSRLIFFIREALRALRRNGAPSLAAVITTVVTVVLLGVLIPIFQTAQGQSDKVRGELNTQAAIYPDATQAEIAALRKELVAIPHVKRVEFITKAHALEELREDLGAEKSKQLTSNLVANPLPASFRVTPDDAANLTEIKATIIGTGAEPVPISPIVSEVFDRQEEAQKIEQVTSALKIVLTVITALLIGASLMLVGNTIRLSIYTRRREVEVMRLVGATRWFIRWPFMIEGMVVGFTGGVVAILILWLGKITVVDPLSGGSLSFLEAQHNLDFVTLVVILFAAAITVSAIGSGVTLRRFLKV